MKFSINDNEYEFINDSFSNSRNWGHTTRLLKNGREISNQKSIYYNRTWESYQYQSCMKGSVYDLIDIEFAKVISECKITNGIKRMAADVRTKLQEDFEHNSELFTLLQKL